MREIKNQGKERYLFIDGLRGIAILWVVLHHARPFLENRWFEKIIWNIAYLGYLGVDLFFVTSGFLITGLLIRDFDSHIRVGRFYARRFFKIVPPYILLLLFSFWINPRYDPSPHPSLTYAGYFLFLQNYVGPMETLAHAWSLSVEEHFYLLYPLLLAGICFIAKEKPQRYKILIISCVVLVLIVIAVRFIDKRGVINMAAVGQTTHYRVDAIIFGCLLKALEPYYRDRKEKWWIVIAVLFFAAAAAIYTGFGLNYIKFPWTYIMAYVAPAFIFVAAFRVLPLRWVLEIVPLRWVGRSSYQIYLWHYVLAFIFVEIRNKHLIPGPNAAQILFWTYILAAIFLGALMTYLVEGYFLKIRERVVA